MGGWNLYWRLRLGYRSEYSTSLQLLYTVELCLTSLKLFVPSSFLVWCGKDGRGGGHFRRSIQHLRASLVPYTSTVTRVNQSMKNLRLSFTPSKMLLKVVWVIGCLFWAVKWAVSWLQNSIHYSMQLLGRPLNHVLAGQTSDNASNLHWKLYQHCSTWVSHWRARCAHWGLLFHCILPSLEAFSLTWGYCFLRSRYVRDA